MQWPRSPRNRLGSLLIVSLAFNVGFGAMFTVRAYRRSSGHSPQQSEAALPVLYDALNLTEAQKARFGESKEHLRSRIEDLQRAMIGESETLGRLLAGPEPDRGAIASQLQRIAAIQRQIQEQIVECLLKDRDSLTADQQRAYIEIISRHVCPCVGRGHAETPAKCQHRPEAKSP